MVRDEVGKALLDRGEDSTIFISSHDLAEIEGLATHITFLDAGRLRTSEDMASLRARFREVEVTLDAPAWIPEGLPATWWEVTANDSIVRFVDSAFHPDGTPAELTRRFGNAPRMTFAPMTLRTIFLAIAKENRRPA